MTDYDILEELGKIYDPKKEVQTIEYDGVDYVIAYKYNRYQVFVFDGGALLMGNI